ncbi:MAG: ATP-binding protein [Verrucomicrobiaceae bacterium]|nr:ATP-binding protein [Verrucomicrobiaceae bacterium]
MKQSKPISKKNQLIPFQDPSFGYGDFEGFFADYLNLHPVIKISRDGAELTGRITNAWRYETSGDAQNGIDIRAEVQVQQSDGSTREETWGFQCKHRVKWSASQTKAAIALAKKKFPADFHFLLVTCDLSSKTVNEGRSHSGWQLWSRGEITARVRVLTNRDEAARLINTYFGAHWAEEILGITGSGPLQACGAFFARQMDQECLFHHRAKVEGRQEELKQIHAFLADVGKQLLILPGPGGSGKSRLLKAFSQSLSPAHRAKWTIRFFDDIGVQLTELDLQALESTPVVIVDDAHRRELEPLLRLALRSKTTKVILVTRPQGRTLIQGAATAANVGAPLIEEMPTLKRLTQKQITSIAESLLGDQFRALAPEVVTQAHGCLLIVVVACELIRQRRLTETHLASNKDFEREVFVRLIDENIARLRLITARERIDRMLDHLSLAGPIPRDGPWFNLLVQDIGNDVKPSEVRSWMEGLKLTGLLTENREGYRVTPDLLADHLLYRRTFDPSHRDQGYAADYLASVPEQLQNEAMIRCLPNLAEAEWRARCESEGQQQSVVEPLLASWIDQFRSASFHRRRELLGHWSRFGVYLPEQTLRIAQLALNLTRSDAPSEDGFFGPTHDAHDDVIDAVTPLLKDVALHHPDHMHECFDLLWAIGCDQPKRWMHSNQYHPLNAITEVSGLEFRKSLIVNDRALAWIEMQFTKPEVIERLKTPVWWFKALLASFLKHSIEVNQYDSDSGVFTIEQIPVDAAKVLNLRDRVFTLASRLAELGDEGVAMNALSILGEGVRMVDEPGLKENRKLQQNWLPQRRDALGRIASIAQRYQSGSMHWAIWHELWWHICYEPGYLLRSEVWQLFDLLTDTFELRLVRATCSSGDSEITPNLKRDAILNREEHSWEQSRELWGQVCARVAIELAQRHVDARCLHDFLADFIQRAAVLGFSPTLSTVLLPLAKHAPALAEALANEIIASTQHETQHAFGDLVDGLSPTDKPLRLDLVRAAIHSSKPTLQEEASRVLFWWRRQSRLPDDGRQILLELVRTASQQIVRTALSQASLMPDAADSFAKDLLESVLANPTTDDITEPLLAALDRAERKGDTQLPGSLVTIALARLVKVPRIHGAMERYHLNHLIQTHPCEVFEFYRQRIEFSRGLARQDPMDRSTYDALPSYGDNVSLACFAKHPSFELRFCELRDEMIQLVRTKAESGDNRRIFEYGGHHWKLRQLARWMLEDSGGKYADLISSWLPEIKSLHDLWLFLDAAIGNSPTFVLGHPSLLERLLTHLDQALPEHKEKATKHLMSGISHKVGSTSGLRWRRNRQESEEDTKRPIMPSVEKLIKDHANQPTLSAFYRELLSECESMHDLHRRADRQIPDDDDL